MSTIYNLKNTVPTLPAHPRVLHPRIQPTSDSIFLGGRGVQITTLFVHARIKLLNRETEGGGRLAYTAPFTSRRQSITPTTVPRPSSSFLLKCPSQSAGPCPTLTRITCYRTSSPHCPSTEPTTSGNVCLYIHLSTGSSHGCCEVAGIASRLEIKLKI